MRNSYKVLTAVAVAGLALAGGSAFTGTGVTSTAGATQFVGGTVSQTVTGATLSTIAYGFSDPGANTLVNQVTLTFADALSDGKVAQISLNGAPAITCENISATTPNTSSCTVSPTSVDSIAVTVS